MQLCYIEARTSAEALFSGPAQPQRGAMRSEQQLAERIRQALIATAQAAHDDAGIRGLCCEGQWEAVVTALRGLDLAVIIAGGSERAEGAS